MPDLPARRQRKISDLKIRRDNLVNLVEALLEPAIYVVVALCIGVYFENEITPPYLIVALVSFSVTFPGLSRLNQSTRSMAFSIIGDWVFISILLIFFGYATRSLKLFPADAVVAWMWITPLALISSQFGFHALLPVLFRLQGEAKRCVVVGVNQQGVSVAHQLQASRDINARFVGYFDDRKPERVAADVNEAVTLLGKLDDLPDYINRHRVHCIYLALPMTTQGRIVRLLESLKDTTASIYFVPDLFITDLIQGRMDTVGHVPVVAVCETPFTGANGVIKRLSDIVLALLILLLISPVLLVIALAVKFTSPGPIIFKQRRYGLDGQEICVYKFRSMTVTEDGPQIQQASKNDKRVTPVGAFLRKSSLDELPQFVNVLQGRMSIVGPRPHAVAHNELYRKLVRGYMIRHKVKPGITGWAQVNGYRGETETVDKMQKRIDYDLDYLRNWSLSLDLKIILKTVGVVFKDQYAY